MAKPWAICVPFRTQKTTPKTQIFQLQHYLRKLQLNYMKNKYLFFSLFVLLVGGAMLYQKQTATKTQQLGAPSSEEDRLVRKKWEKRQLADPNTGIIPAGIRFQEQRFASDLAKNIGAESGNAADWQARGPYNVGGRTRALVLDVTNENRILAGGVNGGVWLSENGGQTWTRKTPLNAHPGCVSIAQDTRPGQTNTWYYISGELSGTSASGGGAFYLGDGMFKSTDGGNTWAPLGNTDNGNQNTFSDVWQGAWRVVVHPVTGHVYAATYSTIFKSTDGGVNWTASLGGQSVTPFSYYTDVAVSANGVLYAFFSSEGLRNGLWRNSDGTNWVKISDATFPAETDRMVIGINPNNENEVYVFGATPNSGLGTMYISRTEYTSLLKYTYVSGDGTGIGGVWLDLSLNLPQTGTQFDSVAVQGGYDLCVKVQPGTNNIFIGGTNLWRSTDGFATKNNNTKIGGYKIGTQLPFFEIYPNHHPDQHDVLFLPSNPNVMLSASDGGLHRTENCLAPFVDWTSLNNGYQTTQFYTVVMERATAGDPTLIGGLQDNGNFFTNSTDPKSTWRQTVNGDGAFGAIPDGNPFAVLSIQQGRLAKCKLAADGTVQAFQRFDPTGRVQGDYLFINPLSIDHTDQNKLYLPAGNRFYRQDDLAAIPLNGVWEPTSAGWTQFPDTIKADEAYSAIGVSKNNAAHRVYLGTSDNQIFRIDNAHQGAPVMTKLTSPVPNPTSATATFPYVSCIAVDPDNADKVILVFSNYTVYSIWSSEDAGLTWKKVGGNLELNVGGTGNAPSVRWVNILTFPNGGRQYFAGTSIGLYSATELKLHVTGQAGTVWTPEGANTIGNVPVTYVESRPSDGLVVAATHGHGIFSTHILPPSATFAPQNTLTVQVSPNPTLDFVRFQIFAQAQCRIFDSKGVSVRSATLNPSENALDLSDLSAGIYYYEIVSGKKRGSGKMVKI
jgi:Secretion system C-terminal sorting domain